MAEFAELPSSWISSVAILSANLGGFDEVIDPVPQDVPSTFHRFTDEDFPPISGLTPRMQYRIPKLFGWEMVPGYDVYLWFDGACSLQRSDCLAWFLGHLGDADIAVFRHPMRSTMRQEAEHIEEQLQLGNPYITERYANGLHMQALDACLQDKEFTDNRLYTSTAFMYRNSERTQQMMKDWWYYQSRYFTVDQIVQPYVIWKNGLTVNVIEADQYRTPYLSIVSPHS